MRRQVGHNDQANQLAGKAVCEPEAGRRNRHARVKRILVTTAGFGPSTQEFPNREATDSQRQELADLLGQYGIGQFRMQ